MSKPFSDASFTIDIKRTMGSLVPLTKIEIYNVGGNFTSVGVNDLLNNLDQLID